MTIEKIIKKVSDARRRSYGKRMKSYTRQAIHRNLRKLRIKPLGRSNQANYPEDAAKKIIIKLGFQNGGLL